MDQIRVLLADDNPTFVRIATDFLNENHGQEVAAVGAACGGEKAIALAEELRPQIVLLDLAMPDVHGLHVIPRLREALPEVGIIVLTLLDLDVYHEAALAAGADDFVSKETMGTDLLPAIRRVAKMSRDV